MGSSFDHHRNAICIPQVTRQLQHVARLNPLACTVTDACAVQHRAAVCGARAGIPSSLPMNIS
jgi:hypothetical protein